MEDQIIRIVEDLVGRIEGPMSFRLIVQPVMAVIFAILDGRKDALVLGLTTMTLSRIP